MTQDAIEALPNLQSQVLKLHAELTVLRPFDPAAFNGQRLRLIRKEDAHTHLCTRERGVITENRASVKREVGEVALSHTEGPPEDERVLHRVPQIIPLIG